MFELGAFAVLQGEAEEVSSVRNGRKLDCIKVSNLLNESHKVLTISRQGFLNHVASELWREREGER